MLIDFCFYFIFVVLQKIQRLRGNVDEVPAATIPARLWRMAYVFDYITLNYLETKSPKNKVYQETTQKELLIVMRVADESFSWTKSQRT